MHLSDLNIRDPFIFPDPKTRQYYLFGSTNFGDQPKGFDYYRSSDLENWEGPFPLLRQEGPFASFQDFWGVEIILRNHKYYLFTTLTGGPTTYRGCYILQSDNLTGPYTPISDKPVSPDDWECLDGGLYVDKSGDPWIVFCHEWSQVHNGTICATKLSQDLAAPIARPLFLFAGSEFPHRAQIPWIIDVATNEGRKPFFPVYVTDAPFLHRTRTGTLLMLWSTFTSKGYCLACAHSDNGEITGNWIQQPQLLFENDGGHAHIFHDFHQTLRITFHTPNHGPLERPVIHQLEDLGSTLRLKS
jgi:arabinan endo-1,5-alpha-L-arabinosidase